MNTKTETIGLITDMLQRVGCREVRLVYIFLRAMMGEKEAEA